ncbi:MAG: AarF/UbiB family protein [Candidatus Bathyarchaeia archaeon]
MIQNSESLCGEILGFCRRVAGSCRIRAVCVCGDYALGLCDEKAFLEILLVLCGFQPRIMNYVKVFGGRNAVVVAVDEWVFERDVDRGFLGEALAGGLLFPYIPLTNGDYLYTQEVKLKKRLILELLENLVLSFPELSYDLRIKPEYFLYETMLSRARVFPPTLYSLLNFMRADVKGKNVERSLNGYLKALEELEAENRVYFSNGYVKVSEEFVNVVKNRKIRFTNFFRTAQRALFASLLSLFPKTLNLLSKNRESIFKLQRFSEENLGIIRQMADPKSYLYVPTTHGLVPLSSKVDVEAFARKVLSAGENVSVKVEELGGFLNDVYLVRASANNVEKRVVVKSFRDWSSFKWFPLTLWSFGTRTFAVSGRSRLERECAINQLLHSKGFMVPKLLHVSHNERLIFMEYVEGENLSKIVKEIATSKNADEILWGLNVIKRVGEKLAEIHALGIALGDTKPENIIVGKDGEIYMLDFEQASRGGDKVWDVAEFLYYAGHYISPFVGTRPAQLIAKAFIEGYVGAGGDIKTVRDAGKPKYTKVFSVFAFPHIIFAISNICKKAEKPHG